MPRLRSSVRHVLAGFLAAALLVGATPQRSRADTPAGGLLVTFVVGVASGLVANAIYDYVTSDSTETTTETDTSTTTDAGDTASQSQKSSGPRKFPDLPHFSSSPTIVTPLAGSQVGYTIGKAEEAGDVLKTPVDIAQMTYRVQRSIKTQLHRKSTFPEGAKVSFDLSLGELFVSTRDIPKTDGWSKLTISVAANGTPLYTFSARSEQGKLPSYSDGQASGSIAARRSDYLALANFKKRLEFVAPAGRSADEIVITILSEGTGRRLPGWSAGEQPARKRKAARG